MRGLILVAGALFVTACSNNDQHDNTMNVDENLTAENIVSNDVTAIDAVTGDAANMAAAADVNDVAPSNDGDINANALAEPAPVKPHPKKAPTAAKPAPKPTDTRTTNTAQ